MEVEWATIQQMLDEDTKLLPDTEGQEIFRESKGVTGRHAPGIRLVPEQCGSFQVEICAKRIRSNSRSVQKCLTL